MRFARYWVPAIVGFAFGGVLSFRMAETPMRKLLASAQAGTTSTPESQIGTNKTHVALEEDDRFVRIFTALKETRSLKRRSDLQASLAGLGTADLQALMKRAEELKFRFGSDELAEVAFQKWLEIDRASAERWIRERMNVRQFTFLWIKADPKGALKAVGENPGLRDGDHIMNSAVNALAPGDPREKARLILELPESPARNRMLASIAREWAVREPADALALARKIPDAKTRQACLNSKSAARFPTC